MTLKSDLIAAKALIDTPEKWQKGDYGSVEGCMCALGACRVAIYGTTEFLIGIDWRGDENGLAKALRAALPKRWSQSFSGVSDFNDAPGTTHADVMALFDRAIAAASDDEVA
jgi:hypothetical protein